MQARAKNKFAKGKTINRPARGPINASNIARAEFIREEEERRIMEREGEEGAWVVGVYCAIIVNGAGVLLCVEGVMNGRG